MERWRKNMWWFLIGEYSPFATWSHWCDSFKVKSWLHSHTALERLDIQDLRFDFVQKKFQSNKTNHWQYPTIFAPTRIYIQVLDFRTIDADTLNITQQKVFAVLTRSDLQA